jgi:hypothetical protein
MKHIISFILGVLLVLIIEALFIHPVIWMNGKSAGAEEQIENEIQGEAEEYLSEQSNFQFVQDLPKEIKRNYSYSIKIPDTCKVHVGPRGGKFIYLQNKSGKTYKYYLPKEPQ